LVCRNVALILGLQALEGKDVKDLLLNVGSGGGAAAAPAAGGAAGGDAAPEAAKEEEKEEGTNCSTPENLEHRFTNKFYSEGGVRRGYGLRSFRLRCFLRFFLSELQMHGHGLLGATFGLVE
jgi:hypothetical protein